jgi:hypothetical protein
MTETWNISFKLMRDTVKHDIGNEMEDQEHIKNEIITWLEDLDFRVEDLVMYTEPKGCVYPDEHEWTSVNDAGKLTSEDETIGMHTKCVKCNQEGYAKWELAEVSVGGTIIDLDPHSSGMDRD